MNPGLYLLSFHQIGSGLITLFISFFSLQHHTKLTSAYMSLVFYLSHIAFLRQLWCENIRYLHSVRLAHTSIIKSHCNYEVSLLPDCCQSAEEWMALDGSRGDWAADWFKSGFADRHRVRVAKKLESCCSATLLGITLAASLWSF